MIDWFEPESREHPDTCRHCRHPFMEHYNGKCPDDESEDEMPPSSSNKGE